MNQDLIDAHDGDLTRVEPNLNPHLADDIDDFAFTTGIVNAVIILAVIGAVGAVGAVILSVVLP